MSAKSEYFAAKALHDAAVAALPVVDEETPFDSPEFAAYDAAYEATVRPLQTALRLAEDRLVDAAAARMSRGGSVERALIAKAKSGMGRADIRSQMVELALSV